MKDIVLQNIIFPQDLRKLPLYIENDTISDKFQINSRTSIQLPPNWSTNFCAYFNAFPVGYWKEYTELDFVFLKLSLDQEVTINIFRSDSSGEIRRIHSYSNTQDTRETRTKIPLEGLFKGGWLWFEIITGEKSANLIEGSWSANVPNDFVHPKANLSITTVNKSEYVISQLQNFEQHIDELSNISKIFIIDQGTEKVQDHLELSKLSPKLTHKLVIINQANLGGSGGFSRGMFETLENYSADSVILLDDDTILETESLNRMILFEKFAKTPTIIGGHNFDLNHPNDFYIWAEYIDPKIFNWAPVPEIGLSQREINYQGGWTFDGYDADKAESLNLRTQALFHKNYQVGYTGWWFCLIPKKILQEMGFSMPYFIKFDDVEYCLRAKHNNFEVITLPSVALWHEAFLGKDDSRHWQSFFHYRNRTITGLLYANNVWGLLFHLFSYDLIYLLTLRYSTVALHLDAFREILKHPDDLKFDYQDRLEKIKKIQSNYSDCKNIPLSEYDISGIPEDKDPLSAKVSISLVLKAFFHQFLPVSKKYRTKAQVYISAFPIPWLKAGTLNSALVKTSDEKSYNFLLRSPRQFFGKLFQLIGIYFSLLIKWKQLQKTFRKSHILLTSKESWSEIFSDKIK